MKNVLEILRVMRGSAWKTNLSDSCWRIKAEEGATSVLDGLDTQRELTGQVKERRDREEELGGATSLYDDFVGVDKEAGLREDARVEVIVGEEETISQAAGVCISSSWDLVRVRRPSPLES
ncbi:unnamed protein product [Brassica oleracea var. botrytis]